MNGGPTVTRLTPASLYDSAEGGEGAAKEALAAHQRAYLANVLKGPLGYAGAKMTRRIVGIAHAADLESIEDADRRAAASWAASRMEGGSCWRRGALHGGRGGHGGGAQGEEGGGKEETEKRE